MTIFLHRHIYHAELSVPKDVRHVIGRRRFRKTLNTSDIHEARRKEPIVVSAWKEQIAIARGKGGDVAELRKMYLGASEEAQFELEEMFQDIVVDEQGKTHISQLTTEENEKAFHKYSILTGKKIPIDILLDKWISIWNVKLKGREQGYRYVKRFCDRFETTDQVSKTKLLQWCDFLINEQGLGRKTVRCILSPCKVYWEYLELNGHVKDNPFIGINLNKSNFRTERNPRQAFTRNEINFLHNELQKKSNQEPELFHLFQIGIYTGARIEEICLIRTKDVSENTIRIIESKTEAGIREIPIHSQISGLIKTLKYRSTDTYLIGNLKINRLGQRSAAIGKKFGRLKTKLGFKKGVHVFHSIRKTVSTLLDQAGVTESIAADIMGHEKGTMTYGLYSGGSSMAQMIEAIEKIKY